MKHHPDIRVESSEFLFKGRAFDLVREVIVLPSGLRQDLAIVDHPGAVGVLPVLDDGRIVMVRQYRHAVADWLCEIPAGRLEHGEDPARGAARELEEETGLRSKQLTSLGGFYAAPGFCSEWMHLFVATGLTEVTTGRAAQDEDEEFELLKLPPSEAIAASTSDAKSWIAIQRWMATTNHR